MNPPPQREPEAHVALRAWLAEYRASVGEGGDFIEPVLERLLAGPLARRVDASWCLELLGVLEGLAPDPRTVCTAMLFAAEERTGRPVDDVDIPEPVERQFAEMRKQRQLESEHIAGSAEHSAEGLRRLLLALVRDVRVVLIALAWRVVELRRAKDDDERARALAHETLLIQAPLANRLGVWQLKWELEDLSFRYDEPEAYRKVARLVAERRSDRERFITSFIDRLQGILEEAGIQGKVIGRPKHIFSIWKKMQRKGLDFHELFDVRAVRVLVGDLRDCYSALGLVHTHWQPIPGEFDDYITTPKGNNYQSLHTAVVGPEGKAIEVQIRTWEMHEHAELGVAAHWRYKEGGPNDPAFDNKIAVMRQLLDAQDEALDDESLLESFQSATSEERVYVLTPKGQVVDLPQGATVLDFAYHIHTEVGHRCRGAKVNGRIVPLTQKVQTGERVEILTGKHPKPSRDWLNPRLGFIRGARARAKVRHWFRRESFDENLAQGRELVEAELKRMGHGVTDLEGIPARFSLPKLDDLFVAVGSGDLTAGQVASAVERQRGETEAPTAEDLVTRPTKRGGRQPAARGADDVVIEGVGNLMTTMAKCCQPVPGDAIVGYVTRGRGVTIHRADCGHVLQWRRQNSPRLLQVSWGGAPTASYAVKLALRAYDRRELIRDISGVLATGEVHVTDISSRRDDATGEVSIHLTIRVRDHEQLSDLLSRLGGVPNVIEARRLRHSD